MDSLVVGCTIGLATCARSKQEGLAFEHSFVGEKMSGEFAHTHSVRKLIASWDIMLLCWMLPSMGTKHTPGRWVVNGADIVGGVCGDCRGVGVGTAGTMGRGRLVACWVILGTLPRVLLRVTRECVCSVNLNVHLVVGLGAVIIGGASVILISGWGGGASWLLVSITLCSTLCSGGRTYGARWRSPGGKNPMVQWVGECTIVFV